MRQKYLNKINQLSVNSRSAKRRKIKPQQQELSKPLPKHNCDQIESIRRKKTELKGLEKVNGIVFYESEILLDQDSLNNDTKKSTMKGCCGVIGFIVTRIMHIDGSCELEIQIDIDHQRYTQSFIDVVCKDKDLSLFFRGIRRYSSLIQKRNRLMENLRRLYQDHVIIPEISVPYILYFWPFKSNPQFQIMFNWSIEIGEDGNPIQKISLLPLLSKKCMYE